MYDMYLCVLFINAAGCEANEMRLVDGPSSLRGRVELCVDGRWSTVCGQHWDIFDARVVCNQLGNHTTGWFWAYKSTYCLVYRSRPNTLAHKIGQAKILGLAR